jgi:predicted MFS family arabinose efflux permease
MQASTSNNPPNAYLRLPILWLMAIACGLCAGSNYFNQPLLHSIATALNISDAAATVTVTLAQGAYGLGVLLLVPLGDKFERKRLIMILMSLAACGLFISGFAPNLAMLSVGIVMTGLFSVAAQIMVPMAATLSDPTKSGRAVGLLMGGLLSGILIARSVAGVLSEIGGWHTVYYVSGIAMLLLIALLWRHLPTSRNPVNVSYGEVMRSLGTLLVQYPRLRTRALIGGLSFAALSVLFATTTLLLSGPDFGLNDAHIGLIGLIGVAGALMANAAGRLADQGKSAVTTFAGMVLLLVGWGCLWLGEAHLLWFMLGTLICDAALQAINVSNQNIVYQLDLPARSRMNAIYMTTYFIGAAVGSAGASIMWHMGGWTATCLFAAALVILAFFVFLLDCRIVKQSQRA